MGCLFDLFFEILLEGFLELVCWCYIKLMTLIVPDKAVTRQTIQRIRNVVIAIAAILLLAVIVGLILWAQDDPMVKAVGEAVTVAAVSLIGAQILLGILIKTVDRLRRRQKTE